MLLSEAHRFIALATAICCPGSVTVPQSPSIRMWFDFGSGRVAGTGSSARARGEPSNARAENFAVWTRNRLRLHSPPPPAFTQSSILAPSQHFASWYLLWGRSLDPYRFPLITVSSEHDCYRPMRLFRIDQRAPHKA